jgi:hypothetical protein
MGEIRLKSGLLVSSSIVMAMALGGCATPVEWVVKKQDRASLNPATVQQQRKESKISDLVSNESQSNIPITSKSTKKYDIDRPANDFRGNEIDYIPNGNKECIEKPKTFLCLQQNSAFTPTNKIAAIEYLSAGITLSNELCNNWFDKIFIAQTSLKQTGDLISATGSLATTMLGAFEADSKTVGTTAAIFGFGKQTSDSINTNYMISADLPTVAAAINEYRAGYAQQIENARPDWTYYTARRAIMAYDNSCSALAVKRFVNNRVSGMKPTEVAQPMFEAGLKKFILEWAEKFEKKPTSEVMPYVYAYLYLLEETSADVKAEIEQSLKAANLEPNKLFKAPNNPDGLRMALMRSALDDYLSRLGYLHIANIESRIKVSEGKTATRPSDPKFEMPESANGQSVDKAPAPNP